MFGHRLVDLEVTMSAGTARVHHAFWDSLVIEVSDLFPENKVFEQRRPTRSRL
jgi:hypothetical protein